MFQKWVLGFEFIVFDLTSGLMRLRLSAFEFMFTVYGFTIYKFWILEISKFSFKTYKKSSLVSDL